MLKPILALIALLLPTAAHAQLSRAERQIVATVESETDRHIALLERLVNQNSGTLNLPGVRAVADMLRPEFEAIGMTVRWVDMAETGRAGHLIATSRATRRRDGRNPPVHILMIGHLDTVFEPSSPFQRFAREGDRATGPGIGDDKGGIVVILASLRALHASGLLRGMDVTVVLTGDEERPGSPIAVARRDLIAAGREADFALEFENLARDGDTEFGTVARRSSTSWTLRATGRTGHSSGIFSESQGYGAIYELARILDAFRRELPEANLTYNVGVMAGGTPAAIDEQGLNVTATGKTNIIAETAIARGDIRTLSVEQETRVRAAMQAIVRQHLPHTSAELVFAEDGYPPMAPTDGNRRLLARLNAVNRALGYPEMPEYDPARRGAADSAFVAADVDTLAGLGMAGGNAHAEGEWVDLTSLPRQAIRTAILMARLSGAR
jgi:glutamate carboxypeptidase